MHPRAWAKFVKIQQDSFWICRFTNYSDKTYHFAGMGLPFSHRDLYFLSFSIFLSFSLSFSFPLDFYPFLSLTQCRFTDYFDKTSHFVGMGLPVSHREFYSFLLGIFSCSLFFFLSLSLSFSHSLNFTVFKCPLSRKVKYIYLRTSVMGIKCTQVLLR